MKEGPLSPSEQRMPPILKNERKPTATTSTTPIFYKDREGGRLSQAVSTAVSVSRALERKNGRE